MAFLLSGSAVKAFRDKRRADLENLAIPETVTDPREREVIRAQVAKINEQFGLGSPLKAKQLRIRAQKGEFRSAIPGPQGVDRGVLRERRNRAAIRAGARRGTGRDAIGLLSGGGNLTQPSLLGL